MDVSNFEKMIFRIFKYHKKSLFLYFSIVILVLLIVWNPLGIKNSVQPLNDFNEFDHGPVPNVIAPIQYLAFQIFIDAQNPLALVPEISDYTPSLVSVSPVSKQDLELAVADIVTTIGTTGDANHKLAFIIGPLSLDFTDDQIQQIIRDAFDIAIKHDIAVGFHIDDSLFWYRRQDLWQNINNIEWIDWNKTPNSGRRLDWGPLPQKLAPHMCFNSTAIVNEVHRIGTKVIGSEIKKGIDRLAVEEKDELFAGVISGWETQLSKDFDTNKVLGYCALTNSGYSNSSPPLNIEIARENVIREFIELWSSSLSDAGIQHDKIYSHIAFTSRKEYQDKFSDNLSTKISFYEYNNFTLPQTAFGQFHLPGFSTYPAPGLFRDIYDELLKQPGIRWASSEGTNVRIGMLSGEDSMETYLARHFNHGAALVNVFAWGVGENNNPFRIATENPEAIRAYQKFLSGLKLKESKIPLDYALPAKIKKIQHLLPIWIRSGGNENIIEPLMESMWELVNSNKLHDAEHIANRILYILQENN